VLAFYNIGKLTCRHVGSCRVGSSDRRIYDNIYLTIVFFLIFECDQVETPGRLN
jgi:hypothetical protein